MPQVSAAEAGGANTGRWPFPSGDRDGGTTRTGPRCGGASAPWASPGEPLATRLPARSRPSRRLTGRGLRHVRIAAVTQCSGNDLGSYGHVDIGVRIPGLRCSLPLLSSVLLPSIRFLSLLLLLPPAWWSMTRWRRPAFGRLLRIRRMAPPDTLSVIHVAVHLEATGCRERRSSRRSTVRVSFRIERHRTPNTFCGC